MVDGGSVHVWLDLTSESLSPTSSFEIAMFPVMSVVTYLTTRWWCWIGEKCLTVDDL